MYKMKVGSVTSLEGQMSQGNKIMLIDARELTNDSIQDAMTDLKGLNGGFWQAGH